ncbi:ELMO domain-containing protein 1-like [Anneissia japonica]|uniref:ELMO domain-containing protein 1-like n=1 Tax=Anneissia japonica TaxID=1529436 RepID=UPI0014258414|nr:ELMO domain-containing protein 1-like [Anneissia japonica]
MFEFLPASFLLLLHRMIKWVLHKFLGACELQRLCRDCPAGSTRTKNIESSLKKSKHSALRRVVTDSEDITVKDAVENVIAIKRIDPETHKDVVDALQGSLRQSLGYRTLLKEVEKLRSEAYSSDNPDHEDALMQLWNLLVPNTPLENRITKQWQDIGFQGDDPQTDFRGMGMLGLKNILYFATQHTGIARQLLSHSNHPQTGYSFAIVGINLTSLAYHLMLDGDLKTHFYNTCSGTPLISHFHQVYCYLFYEFDSLWIAEKPATIMEFSRIREKFRRKIVEILKNPETVLAANFELEVN